MFLFLNKKENIISEIKIKLNKSPTDLKDTRQVAFYAARLADDKKAEDVEVVDIMSLQDIADYVVISSAATAPQLKAIAAHIENSLSDLGMEPAHKEGRYGDKWFLLDYIDFVVHIIQDEAREFYNLEELWTDATFIPEPEWQKGHQ